MPSSCKFELNEPRATYFSGKTMSGRIILNTTNNKNVRYVRIIFQGEGKVKWDVSSSTRNSDGSSTTNTTTYKSHEVYIDSSINVHGDGVLPAGRHVYTFNLPLPIECPTSFEGKYGHIRYELILKINRYYRFDNIYKKPITIIKTIDLNLNSAFKLPLITETYNSLCCWPCSGGEIFYTLKIPFGAYAPGQKLKYALHINNQSNSDTFGYFIEFTRKVVFTAKKPSQQERTTKDVLVARSFDETCLRLTNRIIQGEFRIPSTPPSTHKHNIIFIDYKLKVVLQLSSCSSNMELDVPIIIGTIPIRESLSPNRIEGNRPPPQIAPTAPASDILQIVPTAPAEEDEELQELLDDAPPNYMDISPPTFEEATRSSSPFIDTDIDPRNRISGFKPLYPMYRK